MKFFEEIAIGEETALGEYHFTSDDIVAFARQWDCQAFHVDVEAARKGPFGALTASGWHTACAWMKLHAAHLDKSRAARAAAGLALPRFGASPGFRDLEWRVPVFAGDRLIYSSRVTDKRPTASYPEWGLVTSRNEGVKPDGTLAFAFTSQILIERAAPDAPAQAGHSS